MLVVECTLEALCHDIRLIHGGVDAPHLDESFVVPVLDGEVLGIHVS